MSKLPNLYNSIKLNIKETIGLEYNLVRKRPYLYNSSSSDLFNA